MRFELKKTACVAAVVALLGLGVAPSQGAITDTMDTTANFYHAFPPSNPEQVQANGDGTVSIIREVTSQDSGVDWEPGGSPIPVLGNENLTVTPVAPVNGGYWVTTLFLVNGAGSHEVSWLKDTQTTDPQTVNIPLFAAMNGYPDATSYWLRFRMDPFDQAGSGFTYTEIDTTAAVSTTPEPAALGMLAVGALALVRRRRV